MLVFKPLLKVSVYTHGRVWKSEADGGCLKDLPLFDAGLSLTSQ